MTRSSRTPATTISNGDAATGRWAAVPGLAQPEFSVCAFPGTGGIELQRGKSRCRRRRTAPDNPTSEFRPSITSAEANPGARDVLLDQYATRDGAGSRLQQPARCTRSGAGRGTRCLAPVREDHSPRRSELVRPPWDNHACSTAKISREIGRTAAVGPLARRLVDSSPLPPIPLSPVEHNLHAS